MALKVTLENTAFRSSGNTEIITREKRIKGEVVCAFKGGGWGAKKGI